MNKAPRRHEASCDGLRAFGLSLRFETPPPGDWEAQPAGEPSLQVRTATRQAIADSWSGLDAIDWEGVIDGAPFVVERGRAGDRRFVHGAHPDHSRTHADGTRAVHHLCADASVLQCAPSDPAEPSWWRVVLDSVLFTVALLQGYEALHAGAVATPDGVIAITAAAGGGKSTLLGELLRRGLALIADDVLVLESRGAEVPPRPSGAARDDRPRREDPNAEGYGPTGDDRLIRGGALDRRSRAVRAAAVEGAGGARPPARVAVVWAADDSEEDRGPTRPAAGLAHELPALP